MEALARGNFLLLFFVVIHYHKNLEKLQEAKQLKDRLSGRCLSAGPNSLSITNLVAKTPKKHSPRGPK